MNTIKFALLGTAAIAAVSVSAQASTASDVAALRAQVEALSAQVAAAQTSADLPAGYQFVTTSMQPSLLDPTRKAFTLAIMPTADAPASTVLQWSGFARAALVYTSIHNDATNVGGPQALAPAVTDSSKNHIKVRGQLNVTGKTDTAVGEVGATLKIRDEWDGQVATAVSFPTAIGWWALTPNLTLSGGFDGIVGGIGGYGTDKLNAFYTDGAPNSAGNSGDTSQFALAYADGPISFKIAVGHYEYKVANLSGVVANPVPGPVLGANISDYAFGAQAEYKGDAFSAKVAGFVEGADYQVGVGATASMDMFTLSAAAAIGKDTNHTFSIWGGTFIAVEDATYWNANLFAGASLSDSVKAELGFGYNNYQGSTFGGATLNSNKLGVAGGLYYSPVSQLTIGAEASWNREYTGGVNGGIFSGNTTTVAADLVTVFSF